MQWHVEEISAQVTSGAHAVVILDQAGWYTSKKLDIPDNIAHLHLPPRAPELNSVESIWQFMCDNWLSNRVFQSQQDIVEQCYDAWNKLIHQPWTIISIGTRNRAYEC